MITGVFTTECDGNMSKKLIKRQLIRMRPDLLVYDLREFLELEKLSLDSEVVDDGGLELAEKLRNDGLIDGYVISRGQFEWIKSRVGASHIRNAREKPSQEFERSTFISPLWRDLPSLYLEKDFQFFSGKKSQ